MSKITVSHARSLARAACLLVLAGLAVNAYAEDPKAPAGAGTIAATAPAPGAAPLPPAVASGGNPTAPEAPQGLGIGAPSNVQLAGVPPRRMVLETGIYRCELNRQVQIRTIAPDRQTMVISWLGKDHALTAVDALSGALRYENVAAGLTWLVIVGKAMLLDSAKGQQLANECRL